MKYLIYLFIPIFFIMAGCGNQDDKSNEQKKMENVSNVSTDSHLGKVVEKSDAGDYSYLKLNEKGNEYWIAVPLMEINVGDNIIYSQFMEMKNFESKTLNKTFESVLFVDDATTVADENTLKNAHSNLDKKDKYDINIEPLTDGSTIAQVYENKQSLQGNIIKIKGKVVKYNASIMNRNWIHIQDGTNFDGKFDLLITSKESAKVGDVITAEGTLAIDKDFGAGYFYPVVIENAKVAIDK